MPDFRFTKRALLASKKKGWPRGKLGSLIIANGQTVNLASGFAYDYSSITVQNGGTLAITGSDGWVIIGVLKNLDISGLVIYTAALASGQTYNAVSPKPDNQSLSMSYATTAGGAGGASGNNTSGGSPSYGAGGGGGNATGDDSFMENGGAGGAGSDDSGGFVSGGAGGAPGTPPLNGGDATSTGASDAIGGGGGGGYGYGGVADGSGGLIYFRVLGNVVGIGNVNVAGQDGYAGAQGGNASSINQSSYGGGGGGGGGGGNGGELRIDYRGIYTATLSVNANNGAGGLVGAGGNGATSNGNTGSSGQDGTMGNFITNQR